MLGLFFGTDRPEAECMQMSTTVKSISLSAQVSVIDGVELESERETSKAGTAVQHSSPRIPES